MNEQTKELIALGASVAAHCQPCLKYHYAKARELGLSAEDIQAAIAIGHQVESGARKAMSDFEKELSAATNSNSESCCGGGSSEKSSCC